LICANIFFDSSTVFTKCSFADRKVAFCLFASATGRASYFSVFTAETVLCFTGTLGKLLVQGKQSLFLFTGALVHTGNVATNATIAILFSTEAVRCRFLERKLSLFSITISFGICSYLTLITTETFDVGTFLFGISLFDKKFPSAAVTIFLVAFCDSTFFATVA